MPVDRLAKLLLLMGAVLILTGALIWLASKLGLGRLPGDIRIDRGPVTCVFPLMTSLLLSLLLTIIINVIIRLWHK